jgi:hypothetical protein
MAGTMPGRNGGTLKRMDKGESGNPNGRPRKYVSLLKEQGYSLSEVNDCIQSMMAMTIEELAEVFKNPDATILEKTIANAMKKSLEKGSLYSMETLLTRVYGKPKEQQEIKQQTNISGELKITVVTSGVPLARRESDVDR